MLKPKSISTALLLGFLFALPAIADEPETTIGIDEIQRGQRGYGLSVFAGSEPERFEVEVLGVLRNSTPELSYVLARLSGRGLEQSAVAAGMSGSPVYLDGRLAGAVSFGYSFGVDAIAGITPIAGMRRLSETPAVSGVPPGGVPLVSLAELARREFPADLLERHLALLQPPVLAQGSPAVTWTAGGFGQLARGLLERQLAVAPAGGGGAEVAGQLRAGSAVSVVLVEGDLNLAAHGTLTERRGDEVLAFGHPVFAFGPGLLPMGTSEVITIINNRANSFKVSNVGQVVGAFDQDRQAGMRGRLGAVAPTIPLAVRVRGAAERDYHMRVADLPQLSPVLLAVTALGALDAGSYSTGNQSLDVRYRFELENHPPLELAQSFDGGQAALDSVLYMLGFSSFLALNPLENVRIRGVEVEFDQLDQPRTASLVQVFAPGRRFEPGATVPLTLELQPYRGARTRQTIEVRLPASLPDGRYYLLIGDGASMDAARAQIEQSTPETFEQSLRYLRSFTSRRELRIFGLRSAPGLAVAGEVLPQLPGSLRALFATSSPAAGVPVGLAIVQEESITLDQPIQGALRVDLDIRRRF